MLCAATLAFALACGSEVSAPPTPLPMLPDVPRIERYRFLREPATGRLAAELRLDGARAVRLGLWGGMLIMGDDRSGRLALGYRRTPAFGAPPLPPPPSAFVEAHLSFGMPRESR